MVTVRVTETYDLKTTVGKIGLIGIHTPTGEQIRRLYPGLVKSHKFVRFVKCDVVGACASVLPADPLQVGVGAGEVAPEDMFNPILYKAVTNTSFDTLVSRINGGAPDVLRIGSVCAEDVPRDADVSFNIYYSLLAENGEFRKAMPQQGFSIRNLRPICHTLISTFGNLAQPGNFLVKEEDPDNPGDLKDVDVANLTDINVATSDSSSSFPDVEREPEAITFRGKSVLMPKLPIHYKPEAWDEIPYLNTPKTMVALLVVPPAKLHEFYYRMRVSWTVSFEQVCSTLTAGTGAGMNMIGGQYSYAKNYTYESSKNTLDNVESSVDATDVSINKVMES